MQALATRVHRLLERALVVFLSILIFPVSLQIFARQAGVMLDYLQWTEEVARFCFIWMIMLGSMVGMKEGLHFDVDLLPKLPVRANAVVQLLKCIAMLLFAVIFLVWGVRYVDYGLNQTSEIADLPMWLIFMAWPVTGLAWIVFLGDEFVTALRTAFGRSTPT